MTEMEAGVPRAGEIAPESGDPPRRPEPGPSDAVDLVERAIESVLEQVPDVAGEPGAEQSATYQPWADTAAPPGKNKRPLEDLLADYAARVAAEPEATIAAPRGRRPGAAFFERFGTAREPGEGGTGRRRRRGRRDRVAEPAGRAGEAAGGRTAGEGGRRPGGEPAPGRGRGGRGRPRRGQGGDAGAGSPLRAGAEGGAGGQPGAPTAEGGRGQRRGGSRRRGRRGGGRPGGGTPGGSAAA